jgi:hypothetical protein
VHLELYKAIQFTRRAWQAQKEIPLFIASKDAEWATTAIVGSQYDMGKAKAQYYLQ